MTEPISAQDLFRGRHFDQEIIILRIRWYLTFKLSSRDLVQMMAERGIALAHTTILRWVQRYVPEFEKRWNGGISSVGPGQIDNITTYAFAEAPGRARRLVRHGDVIWSCVRPNRRSHALVMKPEADTIASTGNRRD